MDMRKNDPLSPVAVGKIKVRPALCLDLDGTIRYSITGEFINSYEDIRLFPDVEEALWQYRDEGWLIFGITNQGGVAFGHKTPVSNDLEIQATIKAFHRNPFHFIKACYHHPGGSIFPYNYRSLLRKPAIGMLAICEVEAFQAGYVVDWSKSLMVGDRPEDQQLAKNAGIKFAWAWEFFGRESRDRTDEEV